MNKQMIRDIRSLVLDLSSSSLSNEDFFDILIRMHKANIVTFDELAEFGDGDGNIAGTPKINNMIFNHIKNYSNDDLINLVLKSSEKKTLNFGYLDIGGKILDKRNVSLKKSLLDRKDNEAKDVPYSMKWIDISKNI